MLDEWSTKETFRLQKIVDEKKAALNKIPCDEYYGNSKILISNMMFMSAEFYVKKHNYKAAKQIYRDIIITFVGDAYKAYVKRAEFALEDLKSMPERKPLKARIKS